ncbi:uncharacterized protein LOC129742298 [Uranotaenia lowii]|uniref:uncharacterized protein LOC129742298 n=1 Tax=Uranotaenia lowii TaxID=190385 RepID=UPI0024798850|nr:uncharacterized protein LOC129742298 [Uranotaenia lowii]
MPSSSASASAKKLPSLKVLQTKLKGLQTSFNNIEHYVQNFPESVSVHQILVRLEKLEELWDKVSETSCEIESHDEFLSDVEVFTKERSDFENRFFEVKAFLIERQREQFNSTVDEISMRHSDSVLPAAGEHVRLPQIKLQTFNGNVDDWLSFRDLFTSLIHLKHDLPEVEKLHYLKGCLEGEAKSLIDPLKVTKANYQIAWDLLNKRYNNSRVLRKRQVHVLLKLPSLSKESATELHGLLENFERIVYTLDQLLQPVDYKDLLLVEIFGSCLDPHTRRGWEEYSASHEQDTVKSLTEFVQRRIRVLESLPGRAVPDNRQESQNIIRKRQSVTRTSYNVTQNSFPKCPACSENHWLHLCSAFQRMSVANRESLVRNNNLCRNCFRQGHRANECSSKYSCRKCKARHHTMVCFRAENTNENNKSKQQVERHQSENSSRLAEVVGTSSRTTISNVAASEAVTSGAIEKRSTKVLLATAVIMMEDNLGIRYPARALLDSGSECNFATERLAQRMNVARERHNISVLGIGDSSTKVKHKFRATVHSRVSGYNQILEFLVLPKVTANLPSQSVHISNWNIPPEIQLADPTFFKSNGIDLVLGIPAFFSFFTSGNKMPIGDGLPMLTESVFGWVVSGEVESTGSLSYLGCNLAISKNLDELLERFWSCEEVGASHNYSPEEALCEAHFERTVRRGSDGRYMVTLPKNEHTFSELGDSREIALKRFQSLERRLLRDGDIRQQYTDFMREYENCGHMRKVEASGLDHNRCYLPHHPVVKEASTTTKLRVVFDASCATTSGRSLNDALLVGPVIQQDLRAIVMRCRIRPVMIVADIEKMFRQIWMDPNDSPLQSILWRSTPEHEIEIFELGTVTYGTKPAPFLATRVLKQLCCDEGRNFPLAAEAIENDTYMDDVISGAEDIQTAKAKVNQLISMTARGGFKLRKFASNQPQILEGLPEEDLAVSEITWDQDPAIKALGLTWLPNSDCFRFQFDIPMLPKDGLTKRKVLSIIATLFDPLGLLGATITTAKIFMQRLWTLRDTEGERLDWDVLLPPRVIEEWAQYHRHLPALNEIRVPRCVVTPKAARTELHCFSDASEKAYGGCLYLRNTDRDGNVTVNLLSSKSKVAPLKTQSLPRLELCGALITAELAKKVLEAIGKVDNVHFWSDSTCTLRWLESPPATWTTFVANRVAKIQGISDGYIWKHVPGKQNPADLISRGINPDNLLSNKLWWEGPEWLKSTPEHWPKLESTQLLEEPGELRNVHISTENHSFINDFILKYSTYSKLIRATAYWLRLIESFCQPKENMQRGFLSVQELHDAEMIIIKKIQNESFHEELKQLRLSKQVPRSSPLRWFNPKVTPDGILRIGGRLSHSDESFDAMHPMVLPAKHPFTEMLFAHHHEALLHAGPQLLLSTIRQRYWPLGGRHVVRKVVHKCQRCFRARPQILQQQMGDLPRSRVIVSRPFTKCGVDYFGPVFLKAGRRNAAIKTYVAVFVCMTTKAVHLELVGDLSTERFLQALRRMIGRRGKVSDMYSDNGTNFVGARNQLRELFAQLKNKQHNETVSKVLAADGVQWHFNPPSAPHFGGLWEAAVRSAKYHILRVVGGNAIDREDFETLLIQVEACLNSRPLTAMSDDPTELEPLTPGHFIAGGPLNALPEPDYGQVQLNRLSRWQLVQRRVQDIWKRWRLEYLSQLQSRTKNWSSPEKIIVGKLVIVVDENQPPMRWKMARIEELHPGDDGVVRVVTVKTANGSLKRPVAKLCLLPSPEEADAELVENQESRQ